MSADWETIISTAGEGGSITLLGKDEPSGKWIFRKEVNDIFIDELDHEPGPVGEIRTLKSTISHQASVADSWEKALKLIEQYSRPMLHPLKVHPAFRKQVWTDLQKFFNLKHSHRYDSHRLSQWKEICFPGYSEEIITLASWLQNAKHVTLLTGAGMSTESNIPDFRSKDGWWRNIDPNYKYSGI
jgi:hypothetical protein